VASLKMKPTPIFMEHIQPIIQVLNTAVIGAVGFILSDLRTRVIRLEDHHMNGCKVKKQ